MLTEFAMFQSLIRSKILVVGLEGEDLIWADLLGAIVEIFCEILKNLQKEEKSFSECLKVLGVRVRRKLECKW